MAKIIKTKKSLAKKIIKITLIVIATPIVLVLLILLWVFATDPIFDKVDQNKFTKLDTQMQSVYQKLVTASDGTDEWKYKASCSEIYSSWYATGTYNCSVLISTQKIITSVDELNNMQAKYYPVVNSSVELKQKTELDPQFPNDFGKKFVISSAEKFYTETKTRFDCKYLIGLYQGSEELNNWFDSYGTGIKNGSGLMITSLECYNKARDHWYELEE